MKDGAKRPSEQGDGFPWWGRGTGGGEGGRKTAEGEMSLTEDTKQATPGAEGEGGEGGEEEVESRGALDESLGGDRRVVGARR